MQGKKDDPSVRVCLCTTKSLDKKVRKLQAEMMFETGRSYSYSEVLRDIQEAYFK